jgi:5-formyltetrahydrofolate cyclo-ligase
VTAQAGSITSEAAPHPSRRELRAKRRSITPGTRAVADRLITRSIVSLPEFHAARRIAVYLPFDGEPALAAVVVAARQRRKRIYAPVLDGATMTFAELTTDARLSSNSFGILEPRLGATIDSRKLDLVLTPLVGFDERGVRMGMGRGYYDRCFRFLAQRIRWRRPKLFGVAYELQRLPLIPAHGWDVPLAGVVTESCVRRFDTATPGEVRQ